MSYCYEYPRPSVTVDVVAFSFQDEALSVLLIKRRAAPFKGAWALPGGFVEMGEGLEEAARREVCEETGMEVRYLEQLHTFGDVERDPRGRVISVAYLALVRPNRVALCAGSDATQARWVPIHLLDEHRKLAFDHDQIFELALMSLRRRLDDERVSSELLPSEFTLGQLQKLYEAILEQSLDKRNFRKKVMNFRSLVALPKKLESVPHRSPALYRFDVSGNS